MRKNGGLHHFKDAMLIFRICTVFFAVAASVISPLSYSQVNTIECSIYTVYTQVRVAIYVIAIMLMLLGAAVYAASHIMPSQSKGQIQGYGFGMILGGVAGVIIASLAPFILDAISGGAAASNIANVAQMCG